MGYSVAKVTVALMILVLLLCNLQEMMGSYPWSNCWNWTSLSAGLTLAMKAVKLFW
jgi:membrane protein YdbS with pleckstrin-like domain